MFLWSCINVIPLAPLLLIFADKMGVVCYILIVTMGILTYWKEIFMIILFVMGKYTVKDGTVYFAKKERKFLDLYSGESFSIVYLLDFDDAASEDTEKAPETTEETPTAAIAAPVKTEEPVKKNTKPNTVPLSSIPELTIADEIELGRKASLSEEIIAFYTNERFNVYQMDEIRKGFENGIDAKSYADPERPWYSMMANRIYLEQRRG